MIKVLFVDFDDTLYLHKKHCVGTNIDFQEQLKMYNNENYYDYYKLYTPLIDKLIVFKIDTDAELIMLSTSLFSGTHDKKKNLLETNIGTLFDKYFSVAHSNYKIDVIENYRITHNLTKDEIGLIDDNVLTLGELQQQGYTNCYTPQYFNYKYIDLDLQGNKK